jgi:hypothetical protein
VPLARCAGSTRTRSVGRSGAALRAALLPPLPALTTVIVGDSASAPVARNATAAPTIDASSNAMRRERVEINMPVMFSCCPDTP